MQVLVGLVGVSVYVLRRDSYFVSRLRLRLRLRVLLLRARLSEVGQRITYSVSKVLTVLYCTVLKLVRRTLQELWSQKPRTQ